MHRSAGSLVVRVMALALVGAACSAAPPATGTPTSEAATTAPSPSLPVGPSVGPTSEPEIVVRDGEPWFLSAWYLPGKRTKDLFLTRPDGTDSHPVLADLPGEHLAAAWAPDGTRFAFTIRDAATPLGSIWTANADGSGASRLTDGGGACPDGIFHPSWSPDGSKLSVICYPDPGGKEGSVAIFDPATSAVTRLYTVSWPEHLDGRAEWSPDGASLAFTIYHWDPTDQFVDGSVVAVISATGGPVDRLTTFDMDMSTGNWSPDGQEIAIASNGVGMRHASNEPSNVYAIRPDGTGLRQITRSSVDGHMRIFAPAWTPDGRMLVAIGIASASGGTVTTVDDIRLAFVDPAGGEPDLLPSTIHGGTLRPTP